VRSVDVNEILKKNIDKLDIKCEMCDKYFGLDHPPYTYVSGKGYVNGCQDGEAKWDRWYDSFKNYNHVKIHGQWYRIKAIHLEKVFSLVEVDEALVCTRMDRPKPKVIDRQVDLFTLAKELGIEPPLNSTQIRRAKGKAFIEKIKGRTSRKY